MATIEVQGLTKRFGQVLAVDGLSFTVEQGTVVGFLGPNGAGKTTTLRCLLGLATPTAGSATIHGRRYQDLESPIRQVGAVLEAAGFHPGRTARNHLRWLAAVGRLPSRRVDEVLELVGLSQAADRKVRGFSMGMRQRLALAAALLGDPGVLVLDEPANGLDPEGIRWLRELLRRLAREGRTILVSSHVLAEVAQTVDRVVIIHRGRLVAQATLEELTAARVRQVRARSPRVGDLAQALGAAGYQVTAVKGDALTVQGVTAEEVGRLAAEAGVPLYELTSEHSSLEEVFFELTGGAPAQASGAGTGGAA